MNLPLPFEGQRTMMKPTSLLIALALLSTGCTGGDTPTVEASVDASPPTTSDAPTASPIESMSPTPTSSPTTTQAAPTTAPTIEETAAPPPEQPPADAAAPALSPRGHLVKQIGEPAGIIDGNGERLVNFVVNSITPDVQCTEEFADPAENGVFVAVDVSVQTSPAMANPDAFISTFEMSPWMFSAISPDGVSSNASPDTFASFICMDDSVLLPSSIGPGENAEGIVLLDLQYPSGILIFEDFYTDSSWEWSYPG